MHWLHRQISEVLLIPIKQIVCLLCFLTVICTFCFTTVIWQFFCTGKDIASILYCTRLFKTMRLWPKQPQFLFAYFFIFGFVINKPELVGKLLMKNTQEAGHGKNWWTVSAVLYMIKCGGFVTFLKSFVVASTVLSFCL